MRFFFNLIKAKVLWKVFCCCIRYFHFLLQLRLNSFLWYSSVYCVDRKFKCDLVLGRCIAAIYICKRGILVAPHTQEEETNAMTDNAISIVYLDIRSRSY